jgi:hypothetical protein
MEIVLNPFFILAGKIICLEKKTQPAVIEKPLGKSVSRYLNRVSEA